MTEPADESTEAVQPDRERFADWPAPARWVVFTIAGLVIALLLGLLAGFVVARRALPNTEGQLRVSGLDGTVTVARDRRGVPQITATTSHDLMLAQGYVQAQDRFWQMDQRRLSAQGRLSELHGRSTLASDMQARALGWKVLAQEELAALDPDTVAALEAYADGVNAWLQANPGTGASFEYVPAAIGSDYVPDEWTPVDTLAWLKQMSFSRAGNIVDEVDRARLSISNAALKGSQLYPDYPVDERAPIVSDDPMAGATTARSDSAVPASLTSPRVQRLLGSVAGVARVAGGPGVDTGDAVGSNSWVVSGELTRSGQPLLANDPHLEVGQPGPLYATGLHCATVSEKCPYDVSGFSWAGVPGIAYGQNADIAWGMTNFEADTADLYLEKIEGRNYLFGRRQLRLAQRDERIRVAGEDPLVFTVRETRHGPLVSDVSQELSSAGANAPVAGGSPARGNGYAVAVHWTGSAPTDSMTGLLALNRAGNWKEFRAAARQLTTPASSLVYADTKGNIGYQATGAVPTRRPAVTGKLPTPGWVRAADVTGETIAFNDLPRELNPSSGLIVAANQRASAGTARLEDTPDYGFRAERIRKLIRDSVQAGRGLNATDMTQIQTDTVTPLASILVPYLLDVTINSTYYSGGQQLLEEWDGRQPAQGADSPAAAYFNVTWRNLLELTFHDDLPEALWPDGSSRWVEVMRRLLKDPDNSWWDDRDTADVIEDRDTMLARAMREARDDMVLTDDRDPSGWTWGHQHQLTLTAPGFGPEGLPMGWLLRTSQINTPGGSGAINATSWDAAESFEVVSAPAMRMVIDLADRDNSRWVSLAGQSGHLTSPHRTDQLDAWLAGNYFTWPNSPAAIRKSTDKTLTLRP